MNTFYKVLKIVVAQTTLGSGVNVAYTCIIDLADRVTLSNLETVRNELVPDCNHPKKMNDRIPDGQLYCMNCNLDL